MKVFLQILILLLCSSSAFAQWILQESGVEANLYSHHFINETTGWVVGGSGVMLKTTDGGTTWVQQELGTGLSIKSIYFINDNIGWIAGNGGIIRKTIDAGETWFAQSSGTTLNLNSIQFFDEQNGYAVGDAQRTIKTVDGGASWSIVSLPNYDPVIDLKSVCLTGTNSGWIVGDVASIYKQETQWLSFKKDGVSDFVNLRSVFFLDDQHGWIAGTRGSLVFESLNLLKTVNGGNDWSIIEIDASDTAIEAINSVHYINTDTGWTVGEGGVIRKHSGNEWKFQESGTTQVLNSIYFVNDNSGWIVGNGGLILHTTNGGDVINAIDSENSNSTSNDFLLYQNYPNPFNPTTTIQYAIPESGNGKPKNVILNIYNVLGREVRTLINEEQASGIYEVEWNASNIPNGVYFYHLQIGSFSETKKLIVLK